MAIRLLKCQISGLVPNNGLESESSLHNLNKVANISNRYVADSSGMQIAQLTQCIAQDGGLNNE